MIEKILIIVQLLGFIIDFLFKVLAIIYMSIRAIYHYNHIKRPIMEEIKIIYPETDIMLKNSIKQRKLSSLFIPPSNLTKNEILHKLNDASVKGLNKIYIHEDEINDKMIKDLIEDGINIIRKMDTVVNGCLKRNSVKKASSLYKIYV